METSDESGHSNDEQLARMLQIARRDAILAGPEQEVIEPLPMSELLVPIVPITDDQAAAPAELTPGIPGYGILEEISTGGQATVFHAIQRSTGQHVAIKVLPGGRLVGARRRERFDREARLLATLTHPNIVGIIDRGAAVDGSLYLVMHYVDGLPLDDYVAKIADTPKLVQLFSKICQAIDDAHRHGVVHRDLKPSNIRVDLRGEPFILDFGLARILDSETEAQTVTATGHVLGSLPWTSPEQAGGGSRTVDARSDVYSLGVMLYQFLAGSFPYDVKGTIPQIAHNIQTIIPKAPSDVAPMGAAESNRGLDAIVMKALSKSPARRQASAGELGQELDAWLSGHQVTGRYSVKPARPHRKRIVAMAACVSVLAVAVAVLWPGSPLHRTKGNQSRTPGNNGASAGIGAPAVDLGKVASFAPGTIYKNSIGMPLAYIPAGDFMMGSPESDGDLRNGDETLHKVYLKRPFMMGVTHVTRDQYARVTGQPAPGDALPSNVPVTYVTWAEAHHFCEMLSKLDAKHYRLPTEAEWEYACRAGTTGMISGNGHLQEMGWYAHEANEPQPVGLKKPNAWNLYDMHGNVSQWCEDFYISKYPEGEVTDPLVSTPQQFVVTRGGDFTCELKYCRSAVRAPRLARSAMRVIGFRVVMDLPDSQHP